MARDCSQFNNARASDPRRAHHHAVQLQLAPVVGVLDVPAVRVLRAVAL